MGDRGRGGEGRDVGRTKLVPKLRESTRAPSPEKGLAPPEQLCRAHLENKSTAETESELSGTLRLSSRSRLYKGKRGKCKEEA